ncbi:c2h2 finger domain-containing protein [Rutstroemia sp. NJR-2017a WRK4]|nr:c2h2 finger domain-containing protein [Rutstroemia sp. NJR-2017a WRK4]
MATKRDYQEFIDLTGTDDDKDIALPSIESDEGPLAKLSRLEYGRPEEHHLYSQHPRDNNSLFTASSFNTHPPEASRSITDTSNTDGHLNKPIASEQLGFLNKGSRLALPITGSGLQKFVYDSNTIARDVLIAFNAHPDRGGLNAHLKAPPGSLLSVMSEKWDLGTIDLEYFRTQQIIPRGPLHGPRNMIPSNRGQSMVNSQSQDSRAGHHGSTHTGTWQQHQQKLASVPSHSSSLRYGDTTGGDTNFFARQTSQQHNQPLSYQPESGYSLPYGPAPTNTFQPQFTPQNRMYSSKKLTHERSSASPSSTPRAPITSSAVSVVLPQVSGTLSTSANTPAQRGRPSQSVSNPGAAAKQSGAPKRRGRPPKDYTALVADKNPDILLAKTSGHSSEVTPAASYQPSNNAPKVLVELPKKRGRRFKNQESAGAPAERIPKKRGRPPRASLPEKQLALLEPKYLAYQCEWRGCHAELHNLETLNLHVFKVHKKRQNGKFVCEWNRCTTSQNMDDRTEVSSHSSTDARYQFSLEEDWLRHIRDEHMQPYAWYMGDGPRSSLERSERSPSLASASWLHDENGRQVTPSVENQPIEDGNPKKNNAQRFERKVLGLDVIFDPVNSSENMTGPAQEQDGGSQEDVDMESDGGGDY